MDLNSQYIDTLKNFGTKVVKINIFSQKSNNGCFAKAKVSAAGRNLSFESEILDNHDSSIIKHFIQPALKLGLADKLLICNPDSDEFSLHPSNLYQDLPGDTTNIVLNYVKEHMKAS